MLGLGVQGCVGSLSWSGSDDAGRVLPMAVTECMSLTEISCDLKEDLGLKTIT